MAPGFLADKNLLRHLFCTPPCDVKHFFRMRVGLRVCKLELAKSTHLDSERSVSPRPPLLEGAQHKQRHYALAAAFDWISTVALPVIPALMRYRGREDNDPDCSANTVPLCTYSKKRGKKNHKTISDGNCMEERNRLQDK